MKLEENGVNTAVNVFRFLPRIDYLEHFLHCFLRQRYKAEVPDFINIDVTGELRAGLDAEDVIIIYLCKARP